jgi:hypothetical protein
VDPDALTNGHSYAFRITTTYSTGATVIPGGSADYDNVVLTAKQVPVARPGGNTIINQNRVLNKAFLTGFVNNNMSNHLRVRNHTLYVFNRCPGIARQKGRGCRFEVQALWHRNGPTATDQRSFFLVPGQTRTVKLKLKRQYWSAIFLRDQVLLRFKVKIGSLTSTVHKQLRVVPHKG